MCLVILLFFEQFINFAPDTFNSLAVCFSIDSDHLVPFAVFGKGHIDLSDLPLPPIHLAANALYQMKYYLATQV